jgi:hypothetical protein
MFRRIAALGAATVSAVALAISGPAQATPTTTTPTTACPTGWGSTAKSAGLLSTAPLTATATGHHSCYDRVVFTFRGRARGYNVGYATNVYTDGEGAALHIKGGAKIGVHLLAPSYDSNGHSTYNHAVDSKVANVTGYRTLRDLVYGGSFEGYTTFGVGTRTRLPFRVFTLDGPSTSTRIVLDVLTHGELTLTV